MGRCDDDALPHGTVGRLIDAHGSDVADEAFVVRERLSLGGLPCRPAMVTLRLGRVSHARVYVPPVEAAAR